MLSSRTNQHHHFIFVILSSIWRRKIFPYTIKGTWMGVSRPQTLRFSCFSKTMYSAHTSSFKESFHLRSPFSACSVSCVLSHCFDFSQFARAVLIAYALVPRLEPPLRERNLFIIIIILVRTVGHHHTLAEKCLEKVMYFDDWRYPF